MTATSGEEDERGRKQQQQQFEPQVGPIVASILGVVGWLVFILLYALFWSGGFSLFQNVIVTVVSLAIAGLLIGAMWLVWYRPTGELRERYKKEKQEEEVQA
ncbi:MAG TPA: hypothetical protein VFF30_13170 [Nitrososphaerales archaeon]|nr:hypothetical protein [Nitrososphaerales archaeon]